ncbi:MAG TPA: NfeD family protein [Thermotogaceae bacterium]|nr:NfeD family protein [Thermotogota bacterium]HEW92704.1 NfeD family protein [Thermotogaceae bacterium]
MFNAFLTWVILGVILTVIEIVTPTFFIFWFGLGAFAASVLAYFDFSILFQTVTFVLVSGILVALTRPFAKKFVGSSEKEINVDEIIGQVGRVTKEIKPGSFGIVKVGSEEWRAVSNFEGVIRKDSRVKILKLEGTTLIVEPLKEGGE